MKDDEKIEGVKIPIDEPRHVSVVGGYLALAEAVEELRDRPRTDALPGFGLALAVMEKRLAETRVQMVAINIEAAAKAGIDFTMHNLYLTGRRELTAVPLDLAERAGG